MTSQVLPGNAFYTYSDDEVIWFHDPDHTPHNKRFADSNLKVEIRAPLAPANHVSFRVMEATTTNGATREKAIWFTMSREEFQTIADHVNRADNDARLITAAPDLRSALLQLMIRFEQTGEAWMHDPAMVCARAAIAKTEAR
jgi:hypothetical protein